MQSAPTLHRHRWQSRLHRLGQHRLRQRRRRDRRSELASGTGAFTGGADNIANSDGTASATAANQANGAVAIGNGNKAIGQGSVALGNGSTAGAVGQAGGVAIGDAAAASANAGDVALGSGSVTATAVGTPSVTIGGTTYNFQGINPTSTVSVGAVGAERTITNVAAGRISGTSTDAINGSQLFATNQAVAAIAASTPTHYYSVNDGGAQRANYTSNGATGANSLAAGVAASASGDQAVAQGFQASASAGDAIAIGTRTKASAVSGTAIGVNATASGVSGSTAVGAFSSASATNSLAVGEFASASGVGASAVGPGANAAAARATALGNASSVAGAGGVAVGDMASAKAANGVALGSNSVANNAGDVALGSGSTTDTAVGTASAVINGKTYNFQGTTPTSTVSVGAVGAERTITNVAAGRVSSTSTDAINGSQLFATNAAIDDVAATAGKGWNVTTAQTGTGTVTGTSVQNIAPGDTATYTAGNNIAITQNGSEVQIATSATPNFTSVTTGGTVINNGGLTITGGPSVTTTGINASNTVITNVAPGVAPTDAVNVDQLTNTVAASKTKYYSVNDNGVAGANVNNDGAQGINSVAAGVGASTTAAATGGVAMGNNAAVSVVNGVAVGTGAAASANAGDVALGAGSTTATVVNTPSATVNGTVHTFQGTAATSTVSVGSAGNERTITNVAAGRISNTSTDAINGSQLFATNTELANIGVTAGKGWNVTTAQTGTGTVTGTSVQNIAPGGLPPTRRATTSRSRRTARKCRSRPVRRRASPV